MVPPEGGQTEFATGRRAWEDLPPEFVVGTRRWRKAALPGLMAVHDMSWSQLEMHPEMDVSHVGGQFPPVRQRLVRAGPAACNLYVGRHASHIEAPAGQPGVPVVEGRALLRWLTEWVGQPRYRCRVEWQAGRTVLWDQRCLLHRGVPWDKESHERLIVRCTVAGDRPSPVEPSCGFVQPRL